MFDRKVLAMAAILSYGAVAAALYSQHVLDMLPCAWCVLQRLIYLIVGTLAMIGLLGGHVALIRRVSLVGICVASLMGVTAAWHQWTVAAQSFSCDQTLADRIMTSSGLESSIPWLFGIYATCMDAAVSILGLDFAVWSLLLFSVFTLATLAALLFKCR